VKQDEKKLDNPLVFFRGQIQNINEPMFEFHQWTTIKVQIIVFRPTTLLREEQSNPPGRFSGPG
jgi:hypothetical protein